MSNCDRSFGNLLRHICTGYVVSNLAQVTSSLDSLKFEQVGRVKLCYI